MMKKYFSKRMLVIFLFGFSSGLPLALSGSLLQAWFKTSGVDLVTIGCLSLLGQPYVYKFLWAPLLDRFKVPISLDRRRGWILVSQLFIIAIILIMVCLTPNNNPFLLGFLGLLLAVGSATQDIVIDAYRINILSAEERGLGSALAVEGYRAAMIISGSVGFILADLFGWQLTYSIMASLMLIGVLTNFFASPIPESSANLNESKKKSILEPFKDFLQKDQAILILLFIAIFKIGDASSNALCTPFLLDLKFSLTEIGTINKFMGLMGTLTGILLGGIIMVRVSLFRSLLFFGCLQCVSNLLYALLAIVGKNYYVAIVAFFVEHLCAGMGSAAFAAFVMSMCNVEYSASQYALLSALSAIGRVYIGPLAGYLVKAFGWQIFYGITALLGLPGIFMVILLRKQIMLHDNRNKTKEIKKNVAITATEEKENNFNNCNNILPSSSEVVTTVVVEGS